MARRMLTLLVLAALVAGGVAAVAADEDRPAPSPAPAPRPVATPEAETPRPELVVVRRRGGLPTAWIGRLRRSRAVDALAETARTQWLLRRSAATRPPAGYAVPLDTYVVDPRAYARVTANAHVRRLRSGRVLLSETSARLRRLGRGDRITLTGGRTVVVAGVVDDAVAREAEVVAAAADIPLAQRRQRGVVVATRDPAAVARAVPDDRLTRVSSLDARPSAGGIVRAVAVKERFGEFAVRLPYGEDWIGIDPAWQRRNIVTRAVPILGSVTCHRAMFAPLRRALTTLQRQGLRRLVNRSDYAGCHAPRRIPGSGSLSLHTWGLAVDINASTNAQGSEPRQDPRLVRAFEREGFTWGGRWPTAPDGMHFELHGD